MIGAGAVASKDVPPYAVFGGALASAIKPVSPRRYARDA